MSTHTATIRWTRDPTTDFAKGQYRRAHEWRSVYDNVIVMHSDLYYLLN